MSVILLDLRTERRMFTHDEGIIMTENSYHFKDTGDERDGGGDLRNMEGEGDECGGSFL